jgi:hypothetical protein
MFRPMLFAALAVAVSAQIPPPRNQDDLAAASKNPYDLARFIDSHLGFDWTPLWKALGTDPLDTQPCGKLFDGTEQCSTELITVLNPDQVILLIHEIPGETYLRFLHDNDGTWRFAGVHAVEIRNHPRRHEIERSSGTPFLRVSSQGVRGSGIDSEMEEWFDLTRPGFDPVFSFDVKGYQTLNDFSISRKISAIFTTRKNEIDVTLTVEFSARQYNLGYNMYFAAYTRAGGEAFKLHKAYLDPMDRSTMPPAEFEALADLGGDGPSEEDLIRYTMPRLKELATGSDPEAKLWLKEFLGMAGDTPEVRALKAVLR